MIIIAWQPVTPEPGPVRAVGEPTSLGLEPSLDKLLDNMIAMLVFILPFAVPFFVMLFVPMVIRWMRYGGYRQNAGSSGKTTISMLSSVAALVANGRLDNHMRSDPQIYRNLTKFREASDGIEYDPKDEEFAHSLRFARLQADQCGVYMTALRTDAHFPAHNARATCIRYHAHPGEPAPQSDCTCGYYSHRNFGKLIKLVHDIKPHWCLLHVRLSGRSEQGSMGNRSERQDTLKLWLPCSCYISTCESPATLMCADEWPSDDIELWPMCDEHAAVRGKVWTAEELSVLLDTYVSWPLAPDEEAGRLITDVRQQNSSQE